MCLIIDRERLCGQCQISLISSRGHILETCIMSLIALLNMFKEYLEQRRTNATFKHLDSHVLKDIGFMRDQGHIRPLSGSVKDVQIPPEQPFRDG